MEHTVFYLETDSHNPYYNLAFEEYIDRILSSFDLVHYFGGIRKEEILETLLFSTPGVEGEVE